MAPTHLGKREKNLIFVDANKLLIKVLTLTYLGKVKHESSHPVTGNVVVLLGLAQFGHVVWLLVHKHGVLVCIVMSADSVVGNL